MEPVLFIDIHTHKSDSEKDVVSVKNLFPEEEVPLFSGKNFYSVGLHPWHLKSEEINNHQLNLVKKTLQNRHVVFIGESGPDSKINTDLNEQFRVFEEQALMAEEFKKSLIIHCVKQYNELIRTYNKLNPKMPWITHGYNGNLQITRQMADKNFLFSFGKYLFNPKSKAIDSFRSLPLDKIFFETDEAGIGIVEVYKKGAEIKGVELEKLREQVWKNFNKLKTV